MKRKNGTIAIAGAFALMLSVGTMTAFATEADTAAESSNYSYLTGQQRSVSRNELYAEAESIADEDERKAFLIENGISDTEYSEETAAGYSYVGGRERGAAYRTADEEDPSELQNGYSYITGQQRGSSYNQ